MLRKTKKLCILQNTLIETTDEYRQPTVRRELMV